MRTRAITIAFVAVVAVVPAVDAQPRFSAADRAKCIVAATKTVVIATSKYDPTQYVSDAYPVASYEALSRGVVWVAWDTKNDLFLPSIVVFPRIDYGNGVTVLFPGGTQAKTTWMEPDQVADGNDLGGAIIVEMNREFLERLRSNDVIEFLVRWDGGAIEIAIPDYILYGFLSRSNPDLGFLCR